MSGQTSARSDISNITNATPCVITTDAAHGYSTNDFIRLTDLNSGIPTPRGLDQLNNYKFRIVVITTTTFKIQNPITFEYIDSTSYPSYVEGGFCNKVATDYVYS